MAVTSPSKAWIDVNEKMCQILGYERGELLHMTWDQLTHPDDLAADVTTFDKLLAGEIDGYSMDKRFVRKDGRIIHAAISVKCLRRADGSIDCLVGLLQDITERKEAELSLQKSEKALQSLLDATDEVAFLMDTEGTIIATNGVLARRLGIETGDLSGRNVFKLLPEELARSRYSWAQKVIRSGKPVRFQDVSIGGRWVDSCIYPVLDAGGSVARLAIYAKDITERKLAEEALMTKEEQLRALSARLSSAREEEAARIARELHDELGSALTSLKWDLEAADKLLSDEGIQANAHAVRERLASMTSLVDTTIKSVRRMSQELRPSILDDLGLVAAIEWHAQQCQAHTGIACRLDALVETPDFSREEAIAIFRIFQEAMTNVLRHAQATRVDIMMRQDAGQFVLEVRDNGRGITEEERLGPQSLGLIGMHERARLIGGSVTITGVAGKGTALNVRIPVSTQASPVMGSAAAGEEYADNQEQTEEEL